MRLIGNRPLLIVNSLITCLFLLSIISYLLTITFAKSCPAGEEEVAGGLVTGGRRGQSGQEICNRVNESDVQIIDPQAAFLSFKIPTFDDLKQIFYNQSKVINKTALPDSPALNSLNNALLNTDKEGIFFIDGRLDISSASLFQGRPNDDVAVVVFVKNSLNINHDIQFATGGRSRNDGGLVFVVGGDVLIDNQVRQIDAVIISSGTICTASDSGSCSPLASTPQLVINGSLISLNPDKPINFNRNLSDNNQPAETINYQPKYLVLLRNIFSGSVQKSAEVY